MNAEFLRGDSALTPFELLAEIGVEASTLHPGQKDALDRRGYLLVPSVLDGTSLAALRETFERELRAERRADAESIRETGTRHLTDLPNRDAVFDVAFTHPVVLACAYHVLERPFRVLQLGGRDPLPGYGRQGLHADWYRRAPSDPFSVVTAIWMLDEFTASNGATRVVPGSHLWPGPPPKSIAAPERRHPGETLVTGAAGSTDTSGTAGPATSPRRAAALSSVSSSRAIPRARLWRGSTRPTG